jgi:hypothetical protein
MKLEDLPAVYQEQAKAQLEDARPAVTEESLSSVADDKAEADLQRLCEQALGLQGIYFLHLSPRAREKAGHPDLTFALDGRPIAVELKSATGKLSEDQIRVLSQMKRNGWEVYLLTAFEAFRILLHGGKVWQWGPPEQTGG